MEKIKNKIIGIHKEKCPHCNGGMCECLCHICRPDLWKNISPQKNSEIEYIKLLPTPSSYFNQERRNTGQNQRISKSN